jgi:carboxylesterase
LGERLGDHGYFVRGIRLPGHGLDPEAMWGVTAEDWLDASREALLGLGPAPVRVVGLSMGALIAAWLGGAYPEHVRSLTLLAPAVRFLGRPMAVAKALSPLPLMEIFRPWVTKESVDLEDASERAKAPLLWRFPSARLRDLWRVQEVSRAAWGAVRAPALIVYSRNDHVVDPAGAHELATGLRGAKVRLVELMRGAHLIPRDLAREQLFTEVLDFFRRF